MRAAVVALFVVAACGGRGPIKGMTDGGVDHAGVDAADASPPPVDAPDAEVGADLGVGVDRGIGVDSELRPDLGDPSHPSGVVVPIVAKVGAAGKPLDIPMEVAVDEKYFYFVSQVWDGDAAGPWTLFRLPIAGGTAEPLDVAVSRNARLAVAGGFLYYWAAGAVREYDLSTGDDMGVTNEYSSIVVGSDGVYWTANTGEPEMVSLQRHRFGGPAEHEVLAASLRYGELLAADGGQVFLSSDGRVLVWDIAMKASMALHNGSVKVPRRTALDSGFLYLEGLGGIARVPRVPGTRVESLSKFPGTVSAEPMRIGNHVVWRVGSENLWLAVPVWSGQTTVPVAGLEGCDALLQGPGRLFCVSAFYQRLSEVFLPGL